MGVHAQLDYPITIVKQDILISFVDLRIPELDIAEQQFGNRLVSIERSRIAIGLSWEILPSIPSILDRPIEVVGVVKRNPL